MTVDAQQLAELFALLKVTNLKDAKQSITGLRERVRFTEDYETLRAESELKKADRR